MKSSLVEAFMLLMKRMKQKMNKNLCAHNLQPTLENYLHYNEKNLKNLQTWTLLGEFP